MQVLVKNMYHCDLLECPDYMAYNLVKYQTEFDKWSVIHDHFVCLETFVEWMNTTYLLDSPQKMEIVSMSFFPTEEQKKLPFIMY